MKNLILNKSFLICILLCNFVYSQNNTHERELVFIKDTKLKKILEKIVIDKNLCKESNLVWHLKEKNNILTLSLLINGTISNDGLKYITVINNFVVYLGNSNLELIKSNVMINFLGNEDYIVFQDFSYWIIIKEKENYILKKEVINCGK